MTPYHPDPAFKERVVTFWNVFFILLVFIPLVMLWVFALVDLFQRTDLSGWAKALWAVAIVLFPLLGLLIYFITRPPTAEEEAAAQRSYQQQTAQSVPDQLEKLSALHDKGALTDEEYQQQKAKLLSQ